MPIMERLFPSGGSLAGLRAKRAELATELEACEAARPGLAAEADEAAIGSAMAVDAKAGDRLAEARRRLADHDLKCEGLRSAIVGADGRIAELEAEAETARAGRRARKVAGLCDKRQAKLAEIDGLARQLRDGILEVETITAEIFKARGDDRPRGLFSMTFAEFRDRLSLYLADLLRWAPVNPWTPEPLIGLKPTLFSSLAADRPLAEREAPYTARLLLAPAAEPEEAELPLGAADETTEPPPAVAGKDGKDAA